MPDVPTLHTDHFILRPFRLDDVDAYTSATGNAHVMRYVGDGQVLSPAQAWAQLAFQIGHWTLRGYGTWAVESRADHRLAGRVGFVHPPDLDAPEFGLLLDRPWQRQGHSVEVAAPALAWGFGPGAMHHVVSWVRPDNVASAKIARTLGGTPSGHADRHGTSYDLWRFDAPPVITAGDPGGNTT